jgi:hypothetical protein
MRLTIDKSGSVVQQFTPTPAYNKPAEVIAAGGSAVSVIDTEGVGWIRFRATGEVMVHINDDVSASMPFDANALWDLMLNTAIETITFTNTTSSPITLYRWGM